MYFSGPPYDILDSWRRGRIELIVSPEILDEYRRVGEHLATQFPGVELEAFLELVALRARIVDASPLKEKVCSDPDDDKFLACALAAGGVLVVSGDKALQNASGYQGIHVMSPRRFVDRYGSKGGKRR